MIVGVTAFVPISGHPRSEDEYHRLAQPLQSLDGILLSRTGELEKCWLYEFMSKFFNTSPVTHSVADNPAKNTMAYHIVQAQKTEFLLQAAYACNMKPDVYVWIDYGILHVPGVTPDIIDEFLERVEGEQTIAIPGCWGRDYVYDDLNPCWRFCGGVMVVPRQHLIDFDDAMKKEYIDWLVKHRHVSWEVNTLARLEKRGTGLPIWWYKADHDASLFTNYRATEHADDRTKGLGQRE